METYHERIELLRGMEIAIRKAKITVKKLTGSSSGRKSKWRAFETSCKVYVGHLNSLGMFCLANGLLAECRKQIKEAMLFSDPKWGAVWAELRTLTMINKACLLISGGDRSAAMTLLKESIHMSRQKCPESEHVPLLYLFLSSIHSEGKLHQVAYKQVQIAISLIKRGIASREVPAWELSEEDALRLQNLQVCLKIAYFNACVECLYLNESEDSALYRDKAHGLDQATLSWHMQFAMCSFHRHIKAPRKQNQEMAMLQPITWQLKQDPKSPRRNELFCAMGKLESPKEKTRSTLLSRLKKLESQILYSDVQNVCSADELMEQDVEKTRKPIRRHNKVIRALDSQTPTSRKTFSRPQSARPARKPLHRVFPVSTASNENTGKGTGETDIYLERIGSSSSILTTVRTLRKHSRTSSKQEPNSIQSARVDGLDSSKDRKSGRNSNSVRKINTINSNSSIISQKSADDLINMTNSNSQVFVSESSTDGSNKVSKNLKDEVESKPSTEQEANQIYDISKSDCESETLQVAPLIKSCVYEFKYSDSLMESKCDSIYSSSKSEFESIHCHTSETNSVDEEESKLTDVYNESKSDSIYSNESKSSGFEIDALEDSSESKSSSIKVIKCPEITTASELKTEMEDVHHLSKSFLDPSEEYFGDSCSSFSWADSESECDSLSSFSWSNSCSMLSIS